MRVRNGRSAANAKMLFCYRSETEKTLMREMQQQDRLLVVEDLVAVLQNSVNDLDLPARVGDAGTRVGSHDGGTEDDSEVMRVHAVDVRVFHDAVEMEGEGAQRGVVGIGQAVDDGVKGVTADNIVVVFWAMLAGG